MFSLMQQVLDTLQRLFAQDEHPRHVTLDPARDVAACDWGDHTFAVIPFGYLRAEMRGEPYDFGDGAF